MTAAGHTPDANDSTQSEGNVRLPSASEPSWPQVNRYQGQLRFDDFAAEMIGSHGPDCAYRW
jgi:hypothetical protein